VVESKLGNVKEQLVKLIHSQGLMIEMPFVLSDGSRVAQERRHGEDGDAETFEVRVA